MVELSDKYIDRERVAKFTYDGETWSIYRDEDNLYTSRKGGTRSYFSYDWTAMELTIAILSGYYGDIPEERRDLYDDFDPEEWDYEIPSDLEIEEDEDRINW